MKYALVALVVLAGCSKYNTEQYKEALINCFDNKLENNADDERFDAYELHEQQMYNCEVVAARSSRVGLVGDN